jgi:hypothetical protein
MKKPFRFWMTSGVAIMVAAVSGGRSFAGDERVAFKRSSRYSVLETVHRIEACALRHGMHVLACLPQGDESLVIVLESSHGGTPVQMETPDARPDLLLSLVVQLGDEGSTEVLLPRDALNDLPEGVPTQVQNDLADLPSVVAEALAA